MTDHTPSGQQAWGALRDAPSPPLARRHPQADALRITVWIEQTR